MTKKYWKTYTATKGGWTKWVYPILKGYKFKCCDCGLVHTFQFELITTKDKKGDILLRFRVK